jgi:hypothetical protein
MGSLCLRCKKTFVWLNEVLFARPHVRLIRTSSPITVMQISSLSTHCGRCLTQMSDSWWHVWSILWSEYRWGKHAMETSGFSETANVVSTNLSAVSWNCCCEFTPQMSYGHWWIKFSPVTLCIINAIKHERCGKFTRAFLLLDNAPIPKRWKVHTVMRDCRSLVLNHPNYSSDLALSEYRPITFRLLLKLLRLKRIFGDEKSILLTECVIGMSTVEPLNRNCAAALTRLVTTSNWWTDTHSLSLFLHRLIAVRWLYWILTAIPYTFCISF